MKTIWAAFITNLLFFSAVGATAWEAKSGVTLLAMDGGVLWVDNDAAGSFTLQIKGERVEPTGELSYLKVDDRVIQVRTPAQSEFWTVKGKKPRNERELLDAHQKWENAYVDKMIGQKLFLQSSSFQIQSDKEGLLWSLSTKNVPSKSLPTQLYATAACGKRLVLVGTSVTASQTLDEGTQYLKEVISTLVTSDKPFDLTALQKRLKEGKAPHQ